MVDGAEDAQEFAVDRISKEVMVCKMGNVDVSHEDVQRVAQLAISLEDELAMGPLDIELLSVNVQGSLFFLILHVAMRLQTA